MPKKLKTKASTNIFPSSSSVSTADRHLLNGHSGGLIWFTGLSGSGKSTLAHAVEDLIENLIYLQMFLIDNLCHANPDLMPARLA